MTTSACDRPNGSASGALLLLTGPMFAGKSSALIAHAATLAPDVLVLQPAFDVRHGDDALRSRDGTAITARPVSCWPEQAAGFPALVVDEVQFLVPPHYRGDIVADLLGAVARGQQVVAGGLDTDYLRRPFAPVAALARAATRHVRLTARCHVCDAPAPWTAKRRETGQRLELGCEELYEARCDLHWSAPPPAGGQDAARVRSPLAARAGS